MRRQKHQALAVVLLLATACATIGKGDPVVVRGEDLLVNSLTVYTSAIVWHDTPGNSVKESKDAYKAMEQVRVRFPAAWQSAKDGMAVYKKDKNVDRIQALLDALQKVFDMIPTPIREASRAGGK